MADTELNLEAERAAFEAVMPPAYPRDRNMPDKSYNSPQLHERWQGWLACAEYRRSSSSVSEGEVPELPKARCLVPGVYAYTESDLHAAVLKAREYQRRVDEKIIARQDAELCRLRAATKAAAPADAPKVSLAHLLDLVEQAQALPDWSTTAPITLTPIQIAYVAGKLADLRAAQVPATGIPTAGEVAKAVQVFTCKGKGGEYELVGYSNGAGPKRGESIVVYRDTTKPDVFYHRSREDFSERMEWLGGRAPISTTHTSGEVEKAGWISVEDDRKPKGRTPILVTVDYVRYGEYEDGTSGEWRGQIVTEGEYVPQHGEVGDYFTSYSSPHGDGEAVTHWMPIPAPAQPKDTTDTRRDA